MLLGDLIVWFYENLAGIKSSDNAPGFKQIIMNPVFVEGLDSVNASYHSMHGLVKSNWKKEQDHFTWDISVPGNTTALVYLPASSVDHIRESEQPAVNTKGIKVVRVENDRIIFEIGSGEYHFSIDKK
jgi:alpha-L-rhamnosidase